MGMANSEWSWTVSADGHHPGEWTHADLAGLDRAVLIDLVLEMQEAKRGAEAYAKEALRLAGRIQAEKLGIEMELEEERQELSRWRVGR